MIYKQFDKAIRTMKRILPLCLCVLIPFMTACREEDSLNSREDTVPLTFYLQTVNPQYTRAYIDEVPGANDENAINSVKVWLFDNTSGDFLAYTDAISSGTVTLEVPQRFINLRRAVDVYIIANGDAAGITADGNVRTQAALEDIVFADTYFTVATHLASVPTAGLPMSRIVKGLDILTSSGEVKVKEEIGEIKLTRAVSKIRFAFARPRDHKGQILGVVLNGSQIASNEFIFPVDPSTNTADYTSPYCGDLHANIGSGYESTVLTYGSTDGTTTMLPSANIPVVYDDTDDSVDPQDYAWENWAPKNSSDAVAYNTLMDTYTKQTVYLRESDKVLTGTIYYKMTESTDEAIQTATFTMDAEHDFARNHIWIVYAYFDDGKLYVKPTIAPWIDTDPLTYKMNVTTGMRLFDSWLYRYDTDEDYTDYTKWATSHMVVSEGLVASGTPDDVENRPLRSPQIQLGTTVPSGFSLTLTLDNSDFQFVKAVKGSDGAITSCEISDAITISDGGGDTTVETYFYVIPKPGVTPSNPVAKVFLLCNDPVLGTYKIPFNYSSLPGYSDDSSEIWIYYFPADEYNNSDGNKLKMYFQDVNNPLVPTANQS